ncbi:tyrosine-type recombinase/integrase [Clostridium sp. FP1]|uniref:tyrosine-type recombinase/integrase n=1 Tax=Clostridium sp. FP1 TaxID=2724076 RepID=UPI0013E918D6|nr:tyrosine-type recombinase/integrase [Clostridium sp. FP1]MBZ9634646.1 tyrosine-type recombinase/integrase [Clostridium sp. FP1]
MNNLDEFINELIRLGKSDNTIAAYKTDIEQFKEWLYETIGTNTDSITLVDINQYVEYMNITQKRAVSTINRKVKSVVQFTKFLNNTNVSNIIINTGEVKQKRVEDVGFKIIEKQDLYKLKRTIYASENKRDILIYELLLNTGIRSSELIHIEIDDIHLNVMNGKHEYSYIDLRVNKCNTNREIPLNSDVVNAFIEYMKVRPLSNDSRLLHGQRGLLTRIAINKLLVNYSSQCNIRLVTPYMFRHTAINNMVVNGIDIKTIAAIAGHRSIDSTNKYFVNSEVEDKQE